MTTHPVPEARTERERGPVLDLDLDGPDLLPDGTHTDDLTPANTDGDDQLRGHLDQQRVPGRAAAIQAVRDYAAWLEAHPDVPVPHRLAGHHFHHYGELSREESLATCKAFADRHGAQKLSQGQSRWVRLTLTHQPVTVEHTIFAVSPEPDLLGW